MSKKRVYIDGIFDLFHRGAILSHFIKQKIYMVSRVRQCGSSSGCYK